jgi:mono/diheme cytochrome c family protein
MGKILSWTLAVALLGAAMLAPAGPAQAQVERGKQIYEDKCTLCHGSDGKGNGPAASSFSPPPVDFTTPGFWKGDVDKKIADSIENGKGAMPALDLSSKQIREVIDYMKHTFK